MMGCANNFPGLHHAYFPGDITKSSGNPYKTFTLENQQIVVTVFSDQKTKII